ncbi:MAG: hypothetical protein ACE1ZJ_01060, partial [Nitrospirales bacterium]
MRVLIKPPGVLSVLCVVGFLVWRALATGAAAQGAALDDRKKDRVRARDFGIVIGRYPPGPLNAIT